MKTIAVDFDGVIHSYSKGWQDGSCYDEPMQGAFDGLKKLMEKYSVFIFSTRSPRQIQEWFKKWAPEMTTETIGEAEKPFWNTQGILGITNRKLAAMVYIDDRGYQFKNWEGVIFDFPLFDNWPQFGRNPS